MCSGTFQAHNCGSRITHNEAVCPQRGLLRTDGSVTPRGFEELGRVILHGIADLWLVDFEGHCIPWLYGKQGTTDSGPPCLI